MVKIRAEKIEIVLIDSLIPHPKNNNNHPEAQIEQLIEIIKYSGFRNPIVAQAGTNLVVCGHARLEAARRLGLEKVPVIFEEFDSEAQLYAHMTADNALATQSEIDRSKINQEIPDFGPDFDIRTLGFSDFYLDLSEVDIDPMDMKDVDESTNFIIKCDNLSQIATLQKHFDTAATKIDFDKFIALSKI